MTNGNGKVDEAGQRALAGEMEGRTGVAGDDDVAHGLLVVAVGWRLTYTS